ncbi:DUF3499 domain-containing protein [Nesterenkonia alba]|uniref:DUF3499 domain-containing protein n=1 Tax=Nesterenkonia alba TaxID=515814 RepID=UPI0003B6F9B3|nr:DUF3499 domain-containing protein [Nesterenkonia alba]
MDSKRRCTKSGCGQPAVATLTYSYQDQNVVVGPISIYAEPHTYDLCAGHADRVNPPRGWDVLRLDYGQPVGDDDGDLLAVADAVREPAPASSAPTVRARQAPAPLTAPEGEAPVSRGHLRLVRD